jgi:hypothetical protein
VFSRQVRALRREVRVEVADWRVIGRGPTVRDRWLAQLPQRLSIAGFSLGGLWALDLLRQARDRVERLALIASNAEAASPRARRRSQRQQRLWGAGGPARVIREVKPLGFHHDRQRRRHGRLLRAMAQSTPTPVARSQFLRAGTRGPAYDVLADFARPLLVVSGAQDRLCPRPLQQRIQAAQPAARWVELSRCGHFLPLEQPARLAQLLRHWLQASAVPCESSIDGDLS